MRLLKDRIWLALALLGFSLVIGITGFTSIEGYTFVEALYMSLITFSTVGFQEVRPLSTEGRLFTSIYIIINLGIFAYVISVLSSYLFEGELRKVFQNFLIGKEVKKLKDHVIICGFGRNGAKAAEVLYSEGQNFVIIENDATVINSNPNNSKYQFIQGDATTDEVLEKAKVIQASTLITALPNDPDNVFITLSAKQLNPSIEIIARASEPFSEKKLYRAGANKVVMPDSLGGMHMAQLITKPYVIEFLDILNGLDDGNTILEEFSYDIVNDPFKDMSIKEMNIREKSGASVIALKRSGQKFNFNPSATDTLQKGDVGIVMGSSENIEKFKSVFIKN